jgi:hypothetical protein
MVKTCREDFLVMDVGALAEKSGKKENSQLVTARNSPFPTEALQTQ